MTRIAPLLLILTLAFAGPASAADEAAATASPKSPPENTATLVVPPGAQAGPDFDVETATQAYIATLSDEKRARSDAYFEGGYWLQLFTFLYGLGVAWIFLGLKLSAWIRDRVERWSSRKLLQSAYYAVIYTPLAILLSFPLTWYSEFYREHQYEMATQTLVEWLGDQGKDLLVGVIISALFITIIYAVIRRTGRNWWVFGTLASIVFVAFLSMLAPVYISPLFNDYQPLPPSPLRDRIMSIAHATGVPADDVVWFDASRQTKRISANVSGFGSTMRISLNDNLLARSPPESIESVMGHELGHYTLNHVYEGLIYIGLILLVGFWFVNWGYDRATARWGAAWGLRGGISDLAGWPLIGVLLSVYFLLGTPVLNSVIRSNEAEADRYGIATSGQADGFAFAAMQLSEYRKISPGYWEEILFYDHPSGYARVRAAMEWKAEHGGRAAAP